MATCGTGFWRFNASMRSRIEGSVPRPSGFGRGANAAAGASEPSDFAGDGVAPCFRTKSWIAPVTDFEATALAEKFRNLPVRETPSPQFQEKWLQATTGSRARAGDSFSPTRRCTATSANNTGRPAPRTTTSCVAKTRRTSSSPPLGIEEVGPRQDVGPADQHQFQRVVGVADRCRPLQPKRKTGRPFLSSP